MQKNKKHHPIKTVLRLLYLTIGILMVVLGAIGIFLPIIPTVPFLIVAAWCFSRSSPRFNSWLHNHPFFGPPLKKWKENSSINPVIKSVIIISMGTGFAILSFLIKPPLWILIGTGAILLIVAIYIVTRPSR